MDENRAKPSLIPWIHGYEWSQVLLSMSRSIAAMGAKQEPLRKTAEQITMVYRRIDRDIENLCQKSCSTYLAVCCLHATVWFDLPDLLYFYLSNGTFPDRQIYRRTDGSCCRLSPSGCNLPRLQRPFICTWYICAGQKELIEPGMDIVARVNTIKDLRKRLEQQYISSSFAP